MTATKPEDSPVNRSAKGAVVALCLLTAMNFVNYLVSGCVGMVVLMGNEMARSVAATRRSGMRAMVAHKPVCL
jgi:hypothetical protein